MQQAQPTNEFVELLTGNQSRIYAYIVSVMHNTEQAEEVLQSTNIVLWQKADQFESGTSFIAWAFRVAFFEIKAHRKKIHRDRLVFSDESMEMIARAYEKMDQESDDGKVALEVCMKKLSPKARNLLKLRYFENMQVTAMADQLGQTANVLAVTLHRIRTNLAKCIKKTGTSH